MELKTLRPDGLLKDVSDNFTTIARSFKGEVAAVIEPRIASTKPRAMASPRPVPART